MMRLPLVEYLKIFYTHKNLKDVCIIGHQHLLETTHLALRSLFDLGLQPKNVHLIGKCYSSNYKTVFEMKKEGINICDTSFFYDSHQPYDKTFDININNFLKNTLHKNDLDFFEKTIVIDDGGHCINYINTLQLPFQKIVGIEQTTSGYEKVKKLKLNFSVINIARSEAKLIHETPMIAEISIKKMSDFLNKYPKPINKALIVGGGHIGQGIYDVIHNKIETRIYDKSPELSQISEADFIDHLGNSDLILGCTGTISIPQSLHKYIRKGVLVSASSTDREFDAVHLRKNAPRTNICHQNINIKNITLANSGFPVNFDGGNHSVSPEKIQLTRSLIILGIFQALDTGHDKEIIPLDLQKQKELVKEFYNHISINNNLKNSINYMNVNIPLRKNLMNYEEKHYFKRVV